MDKPPPFEPLDEDWDRALVVVAHPDDMEYGAAAAIAKFTAQGKQVAYSLITSGEAGIDGLPPDECAPVREAEQRAACHAVGVSEVEFLHFPDGTLEYGLPLRYAIAASIRRHRPEIVITTNFRETYGGVMLNQADHIAACRRVGAVARSPSGLGGRVTRWSPRGRRHRFVRGRSRFAPRAPRLPRRLGSRGSRPLRDARRHGPPSRDPARGRHGSADGSLPAATALAHGRVSDHEDFAGQAARAVMQQRSGGRRP
jgi:LmbE family N-acetylglucosaminyl deacetylase